MKELPDGDEPTVAPEVPPAPKTDDLAGIEHTLAAAGSSLDATLAVGSAEGDSVPPVVVRAGGVENYPELVQVDPRHYVVGKEIARGGMGRIMAARDRRLGRPVAIKQLLHDSSAVRLRFEREVRVTAKLQHPAIVSILEAGQWPGGEPFYAMKLVTGQSLDRAILARPTLDERLGLLPNVIACVDALAYAHTMKVIHRDLKPANVLVGEFGETVVIDWGLAKDLADTDAATATAPTSRTGGETVIGAVMGTPAYMPPEQAAGGAVGERADVYSLGAMIYHLLAGSPPYTGRNSDEVLEHVKKGPPSPLEDRAPGVPTDLATIVSKAMAREAADRYPTANELAADLKRFQTGQLVGAHRYSTAQLVRRWVRRHRTAVTVAGIAAALLIGLAIVGVRRIVGEQARTEHQRAAAERNRGRSEDLMNFMLTDLRGKLEPLGKLPLLDAVAAKAVQYYEDQGEALGDQELNRRAIAHSSLGFVLQQQGDLPGALAQQQASLAIHRQLAEADPGDPVQQRNLAAGHKQVGDVFRAQGDLGEALVEYRAVLAICERLVATEPTNAARRDLAIALERVGLVQMWQGDLNGALETFRASLAISARLVAIDGTNAAWQRGLWLVHGDIGDVLLRQRDVTGALAEYRTSLALAEQVAAGDRKDMNRLRDVATSSDRVAEALQLQGDLAGSLERYRAGVTSMEALTDRDPTNAQWQRDLAVGHASVASLLQARGDASQALVELRAALVIMGKLALQDPSNADWKHDLAHHSLAIGDVLRAQKDPEGALESYRTGVGHLEELVARTPTNAVVQRLLYIGYGDIGAVLEDRGDWAGALEPYRASLAVAKQLATLDPTSARAQDDLAYGHESVGDAQRGLGDHAAALESYRAILPIRQALVDGDPTSTDYQDSLAICHGKVGDVLLALKDPGGALVEVRAALAIKEKLAEADPTNPELARDVVRLRARVRRLSR